MAKAFEAAEKYIEEARKDLKTREANYKEARKEYLRGNIDEFKMGVVEELLLVGTNVELTKKISDKYLETIKNFDGKVIIDKVDAAIKQINKDIADNKGSKDTDKLSKQLKDINEAMKLTNASMKEWNTNQNSVVKSLNEDTKLAKKYIDEANERQAAVRGENSKKEKTEAEAKKK